MKTRRSWYLVAFFLPFLISVIICIANGVFPFGNNCILHVDMYHQYCPFFTEFQNKLQSGGSLLYTWKEGLGSDFVSLYAYYLASPLNWLLLVWPKGYVIEFMTLTILIKIAFAGFGMFVFFDYHFNLKAGKTFLYYFALVFATAYALSGYVAAYSWNIMWMDGIAIAPVILWGLELLVKEGKPIWYYVSLSIAILSNYYIGMILCIFLSLYFVTLLCEPMHHRLQAIGRFIWYSLLAGGTATVLLIPEAYVLSYSGSAGFHLPKTVNWYFGFWEELSRMSAFADVYTGGNHWPNLYAGTFSILLCLLYVLNRYIPLRRKLLRIFLIAFLLLSFSNNILDFIWHGFHFPDSLPARQSFLFVFLLLEMGFHTLVERRGIGVGKILLAFVISIALILAEAFVTPENVTKEFAFIMTGIFLTCYVLLMLIEAMVNAKWRKMVAFLAGALAMVEIIANMAYTGFYTTSRAAYLAKAKDYEMLLDKADRLAETDTFYRVEDLQRNTKNDSALYGYSSATEFSSLMNIHVSHFYQKMYMEGGKNFYCYNGATPLLSAMMSVKYVLMDHPFEDGAIRNLVEQSGDQYLYRNKYWLPIGYLLPFNLAEDMELSSSGTDNLNQLAHLLGAEQEMINRVYCKQTVEKGKTSITIGADGIYYASYAKCSADSLIASSSSGWKRKYAKTTHRYLLEFSECKEGDVIEVTNTKGEEIRFSLYQVNMDAVDAAYQTLSKYPLEQVVVDDKMVSGIIDAKADGRLFFSIPYQKGWKLWVDGKSVEVEPFGDAFISARLPRGEHSIKLKYQTPGLAEGSCISIICLILFGISAWKRRKEW